MLDSVEAGLACGSDTAHLSILGYNPLAVYRGRGAFESMGAGLDMQPGDIAFKSNFAVLDLQSKVVKSRRADRNFEKEGPILCEYLQRELSSLQGYQVFVKYSTEHRCGISIRGVGLSDRISGTDPLKDGKKLLECTALDDSIEAKNTSVLVNSLSSIMTQLLLKHPINEERRREGKDEANCILLRGCGVCIDVEPFERMHGMKGFMIAPTCIIAGLGKSIGLDVIECKGATGDYNSDYNAKGRMAVAMLKQKKYDFAFIHIKGIDDAGHDRCLQKKIEMIEKADSMIGVILKELGDEPVAIVVTSDHSTTFASGDHSYEPVPFLISARNFVPCMPVDSVQAFSEVDCVEGHLGRFVGLDVFEVIKRFIGLK